MSFQRTFTRLALGTRLISTTAFRRLPQFTHQFSRAPLQTLHVFRQFSTHTEVVPPFPESVSEGSVQEVAKAVGDYVKEDDVLVILETDKATLEIKAQKAGKITELLVKKGDIVKGGTEVVKLDLSAASSKDAEKPKEDKPKEDKPKEDKPKEDKQSKKEESPKKEEQKPSAPPAEKKQAPKETEKTPPPAPGSRGVRRVAASRMRLKIAERLKDAQNTAAMLTTFNEVDMSAITELRNRYKEDFEKTHKIKLGFMSAFVKASTFALQKFPDVNAYLDLEKKEIVYRDFIDVSVAVATPTGLVVPVLRNTENMNFADIETAIFNLGQKARKNQITVEDMIGGTFTISNGGVFGSLMGTPIINPPQSAILGMHAVNKRPVVVNDQIVIRPMMYLALTYDHRMIDGSTAVQFLKTIKQVVEDPSRLLLSV